MAYQRLDQAGQVVFDIAPEAELPAEIGDGRRFATGDSEGLPASKALDLAHPLVRAARGRGAGVARRVVELALPADTPPDVAALAGQSGVLALALVDYAGFTGATVVAGAVINDDSDRSVGGDRLVSLQAADAERRPRSR